VILSAAAQHEMGLACAPKTLPAAARNAVFRSLIKTNLLTEINAPRDFVGLGWRQDEDGTWIVARITDEGLRAIGIDPNAADAPAEDEQSAEATAIHKAERSGRIAREPDGQWDTDKTRRRLTETADPARSPLASSAGAEVTPFARLKVAQLTLKVKAQRLSLDETKQRLVDVTEANAALDDIGSAMRDALPISLSRIRCKQRIRRAVAP
jgi:hypothetical protein